MKTSKHIISAFAALLAVASCSDINKTQKEWLDRGETIYAGKIDSLVARGGEGRIMLEGYSKYTYNAKTVKVTYMLEGQPQTREFSYSDVVDGKFVRIYLDNIPEGAYDFVVYTFDKDGNSSVISECAGNSYGNEFKLTQIPVRASNMTPQPDGSLTLACSTNDKASKVVFVYEGKDGRKTLEVEGSPETVSLPGWKKGGEVTIYTYFLPEEKAIDVISAEPLVQSMPTEVVFVVDKKKFKAVDYKVMTNDIEPRTQYGGPITTLWDGTTSTNFHTGDGQGVPYCFTIDLGVRTHLTKFKMSYARADFTDWAPHTFEIWGSNVGELTTENSGVDVPVDDTSSNFDDAMTAKGWTRIIHTQNPDRWYNTFDLEDAGTYR
ncbi:MAG: hypothetical protein HUJ94_06500, partial [Bacteroidales bacterium]|nr:hypothetical protein [Bacteroidales bacterium]